MALLETILATHDDAESDLDEGLPGCTVKGRGTIHVGRPHGFGQWAGRERLRAGTTLTWSDAHGDQAVVVVEGSVRVGDDECGRDGAVIIEAGAPATLVVVEDTEILHYGDESNVARVDTPTVHVVGAEGHGTFESPSSPGSGGTFYVDSSCPGCDITVFRVWSDREYLGSPHSHSVDELIHVTSGVIWIDEQELVAGTTIAIPADRTYTFRAHDAFQLFNYRRAASMMTRDPSKPAMQETRALST